MHVTEISEKRIIQGNFSVRYLHLSASLLETSLDMCVEAGGKTF